MVGAGYAAWLWAITLMPGSIGTAATLGMVIITLAHMAIATQARLRRKRMLFPFGLVGVIKRLR